MGAHSIETVIPWCTRKELEAKFQALRESDEREYGTDPYNGSWSTIGHVTPDESRVFTDQNAAGEYCLQRSSKWDNAMAVPLVKLEFSKAAQARVDKIEAKVKAFKTEKLYPLEGRELRPSGWAGNVVTHWNVTEPAWEQVLRHQILARVKAGASKFKKCGKCGSTLAVALLSGVTCPLCRDPFLITPTDEKAFEGRKAKIAKAQAELAVLQADLKKATEDAKKDAKEVSRQWYIGGWAAC